MPGPIKVIEVELSRPLSTFAGLGDYRAVMALVRLYGAPIGYVQLPVRGGECTGAAFREAILDTHSYAVVSNSCSMPCQHLRGRVACALMIF